MKVSFSSVRSLSALRRMAWVVERVTLLMRPEPEATPARTADRTCRHHKAADIRFGSDAPRLQPHELSRPATTPASVDDSA
jgi:hypothetical protein